MILGDSLKALIAYRLQDAREKLSAAQEAATVFGDSLAITFEDPDHTMDEKRYTSFG